MHTEEQAKKLWCPMARTWTVETSCGIENMVSGHNESATCIASGCMMWRKERTASVPPKCDTGRWEHKGYCGLAPLIY